ncbi:hypothetical protein V6N13_136360 [Hibiscus sabdariffa]|uniref:C2 domain-containing protein n=1 Tax=Hibiscus sabdariffa TaxID=183260 RepID=A0ABR2DNT6_9ROSI
MGESPWNCRGSGIWFYPNIINTGLGVSLPVQADPFVITTVKKSEAKAMTRVANETLNPVWNQTFDFVVEDALHCLLHTC